MHSWGAGLIIVRVYNQAMLSWIQNLEGLQDSNTQEQEIRLVENLYKSLHSSEKSNLSMKPRLTCTWMIGRKNEGKGKKQVMIQSKPRPAKCMCQIMSKCGGVVPRH